VGECKANVKSERALAECVPLIESGKLRAGGLLFALHTQRFHLLAGMAMGRCMPHSASVSLRVEHARRWIRKKGCGCVAHLRWKLSIPPSFHLADKCHRSQRKCQASASCLQHKASHQLSMGTRNYAECQVKQVPSAFWGGQTVPSSATPLTMGCTPRAAHPGLHTQGCTPRAAHPDQQGLF